MPTEAVEEPEKPSPQPVNVAEPVVPIVVYVPESLFKMAPRRSEAEEKREEKPQQTVEKLIWREGEKP
ncbi:MAG: hypothetical protein ACPL4I_11400 [Bacteroidota bacterium]